MLRCLCRQTNLFFLPLYAYAHHHILKNPFNNFNAKHFSSQNNEEIMKIIKTGVLDVIKSSDKCKKEKLNTNATLHELGFDDFDQVELIIAMENKFGIDLTDEDSFKINSIPHALRIMSEYYSKSFPQKKENDTSNVTDMKCKI